jgi:hypothetical protein
MLPYAVSAYCVQRGYAERDNYLQIVPSPGGKNKDERNRDGKSQDGKTKERAA